MYRKFLCHKNFQLKWNLELQGFNFNGSSHLNLTMASCGRQKLCFLFIDSKTYLKNKLTNKQMTYKSKPI